MTRFWKTCRNEYQSSAKVVDGSLILSLPDAINPIVWRMELGNVKSSALEVRANDNDFLLTLKTPKGDVHDIAPFNTREKAVSALMKVSEALGKADGKMSPAIQQTPAAPVSAAQQPSHSGYKWIAALAIVLGLIFIYSYLSKISPRTETLGSEIETTTGNTAPAPNNAESGVPLSADDYLRGF